MSVLLLELAMYFTLPHPQGRGEGGGGGGGAPHPLPPRHTCPSCSCCSFSFFIPKKIWKKIIRCGRVVSFGKYLLPRLDLILLTEWHKTWQDGDQNQTITTCFFIIFCSFNSYILFLIVFIFVVTKIPFYFFNKVNTFNWFWSYTRRMFSFFPWNAWWCFPGGLYDKFIIRWILNGLRVRPQQLNQLSPSFPRNRKIGIYSGN